MGTVQVTIDLENTTDADNAAAGLIAPSAVRRATVRALVDTGALPLVLPEDVVTALGLTLRGKSAVPMEILDVLVEPAQQQLIVRPSYRFFRSTS